MKSGSEALLIRGIGVPLSVVGNGSYTASFGQVALTPRKSSLYHLRMPRFGAHGRAADGG
jgi:hypothetical protein